MFPRVLLMANNIADGSNSLVILMMFACISGSAFSNAIGTILPININATKAKTAMRRVAAVSMVLAISRASFSSFVK